MTPELLERLRVATSTIVARYGKPLRPTVVVALDANNSFSVAPAAPLVFEQGQLQVTLLQTGPNALTWSPTFNAQLSGMTDWVEGVAARKDSTLVHNSDVLLYRYVNSQHTLSIGVGPAYVGAPGYPFYSQTVFGPIVVTDAVLATLIAAMQATAS